MKRKTIIGVVTAMALLIPVPTALAFGGPNEAGKSGHFHPNSSPCQGANNHPHCPGPH